MSEELKGWRIKEGVKKSRTQPRIDNKHISLSKKLVKQVGDINVGRSLSKNDFATSIVSRVIIIYHLRSRKIEKYKGIN